MIDREMLLTNEIGRTDRLIAIGYPTGWILIIIVESTNSMQVYMYFTRSVLFKTLCLTLICNIKKDFALRNPVIFLHFKCREGKSTCTGKYNGFVRENILNKHKCEG